MKNKTKVEVILAIFTASILLPLCTITSVWMLNTLNAPNWIWIIFWTYTTLLVGLSFFGGVIKALAEEVDEQ